jgi:hypothetical protein
MDSSTTPPPDPASKPLSDFQAIGHNTYLWSSPSYLSKDAGQTPLVLVFSWNAASAKHIAKYTISYQKLFPTCRILLVRCFTRDMIRLDSTYAQFLAPAMDIVHQHVQSGGEVLVHSFSNGGGNQANEFAKAWRTRFGSKLPMRVQVLDSSPTKAPWMRSHAAIVLGLPKTLLWKWFGGAFIHFILLCYYTTVTLMGSESKHNIICRGLNDKSLFDSNVPRVYLYSRADQMVLLEEVVEHADIAESKGWDVVKVQFEKSAHCGHLREDEAKYWAAVMEAWRKGPRKA